MAGGRLARISAGDMPQYRIKCDYPQFQMFDQEAPALDIAAVCKRGNYYVSIVNRSLEEAVPLCLDSVKAVSGETYTSTDPFGKCKWQVNPELWPVKTDVSATVAPDGKASLSVPPLSYTLLEITPF
jgi:hypothetical protein